MFAKQLFPLSGKHFNRLARLFFSLHLFYQRPQLLFVYLAFSHTFILEGICAVVASDTNCDGSRSPRWKHDNGLDGLLNSIQLISQLSSECSQGEPKIAQSW